LKAALLLGTTSKEYIQLRKELAAEFAGTPKSNAPFALLFGALLAPDASQRPFAQIQRQLKNVNSYLDMFARIAESTLGELGSSEASETLNPEQLASAREVLNALKSCAARNDFGHKKRVMMAINAPLSAFRAASV